MGLGDLWVKGRGVWMTARDFYLGPRLAVKIPVGKVDYTDTKPELGDDQADVDLAVIAAKYGESTMFKFNGQLGFRYRMKYTVDNPDPIPDADVTPGMVVYTQLEPGLGVGDQRFQVYLPIGYETSMENKIDGTAVTDSDTNALWVGLYPKYELDANNDLGLKFMMPVMGKNVPAATYVTLTYEAFIKL
jgi:hypothetical protein